MVMHPTLSCSAPADMQTTTSGKELEVPPAASLAGSQAWLVSQQVAGARNPCHGSDANVMGCTSSDDVDKVFSASSGLNTPCRQPSSVSIRSCSSIQSSKSTQLSGTYSDALDTTQPTAHSPSTCNPGHVSNSQIPGAWRVLAGTGSNFVRAVGTTCKGYLESSCHNAHESNATSSSSSSSSSSSCSCLHISSAAEQNSHNLHPTSTAWCTRQLPWFIVATAQPEVAQSKRHVFSCSWRLLLQCRFTPIALDCASAGCADPSLYQLVLGWPTGQSRAAAKSYIAVQADCRSQQWTILHITLSARHSKAITLASAVDRTLVASSFCKLKLQVSHDTLTLHRDDDHHTCLFSNVPLTDAFMTARSTSTTGQSQGHNNAPAGFIGMAVCNGRLDFGGWELTTMQAAGTLQSAAQMKAASTTVASQPAVTTLPSLHAARASPMRQVNRQACALKKQQAKPQHNGTSYAHDVFGRCSPAVATAVAVSTAGAARGRWSRKPHISDADPHLVEAIMANIIAPNDNQVASFDDIASLSHAKQLLHEALVLPLLLPNLFTGIRAPWKGVLLFGPAGTGKTMLARAVASIAGITFFATSSASLTSKWRGDSEKLVRTLFAVAAHYAPAVIFIDEIDALASCSDMDGDGDASRRFRAELLQQLDGIVSGSMAGVSAAAHASQRVMLLAATNRPWMLDSALRRRLEKRVLIPLPDQDARHELFSLYLKGLVLADDVDASYMAACTEGYSGADIKTMCRDAAMQPMRRLVRGCTMQQLKSLHRSHTNTSDQLLVEQQDLLDALSRTQPSVLHAHMYQYQQWEQEFAAS